SRAPSTVLRRSSSDSSPSGIAGLSTVCTSGGSARAKFEMLACGEEENPEAIGVTDDCGFLLSSDTFRARSASKGETWRGLAERSSATAERRAGASFFGRLEVAD